MAIVDMKGTVSKDQPTMTGMMNEAPKTVDPPKLSGMNKLFENDSFKQLEVTNIKNQTNRLEELFLNLTSKK